MDKIGTERNWIDRNVKVDVDRELEALEIVYRAHGAPVEGLEYCPEDVLFQR